MSKLVQARAALFKAVSRGEFDEMPRTAKRKLWAAACKQVGHTKPMYKSSVRPKKTVKPRKSRAKLVAWAQQVAQEVETKRQQEHEQRHYDRFPHYYTGSRW